MIIHDNAKELIVQDVSQEIIDTMADLFYEMMLALESKEMKGENKYVI